MIGLGGQTAVEKTYSGEYGDGEARRISSTHRWRPLSEVPRSTNRETLEYKRANAGEREDDEKAWIASDVSFAIVCHCIPASPLRKWALQVVKGYAVCRKGGASHTNGPYNNPFIHSPFNNAKQEKPHRNLDETDPRDEE